MKYYWLGSLLALLLSACSPTPAGQAAGPIRIRWARDPESLDPLAQPNPNAVEANGLLYLPLLKVDYQHQVFAPALAQELPSARRVGDSLTLLDYQLRPGATWDDGRPVLAADVDFTLKLLHCPGLPNEGSRAQFGFIEQLWADTTNPRHFTLVCRGQGDEIVTASGDFPILPEAALDPTHSLRALPLATLRRWPASQAPAPAVAALVRRYQQANLARHPEHLPGCGPYRLAGWETNRQLRFARKTNWWADKLRPVPPVLQARAHSLAFSIVPDDAAAALALRRHELDVYPQVPARIFQQLQGAAQASGQYAFYTQASYDVLMAGFNTQRPALRDRRTRQALSYLFDPTSLLAATQLGQGTRTASILAPGSPFYHDSLPLPSYDPVRAQALLGQAGWQRRDDGHWHRPNLAPPLALGLRYRAEDQTFATVALQFQAAATQVGIPVTLLPTESTTLTRSMQTGDFDLYVRLIKGNPFGFNFIPILHSQSVGVGNLTSFSQPVMDRLLEHIAAEGNLRRKRLLLRRFQVLMHEEKPLVPLFFLPYRLAVSRRLAPVIASGLRPGYAVGTLAWATDTAVAAGH